MIRIDIVTIFPSVFDGPFDVGLIKRAREKGLVEIDVADLRQFTLDRHRTVDDYPFGGGPGMVMKVEPLYKAVETLRRKDSIVVLLSPQGNRFDQDLARSFSKLSHLILLCGRYKGVDERARQLIVDEEISVGDYILSGGEIPAMVVTESVVRLLPGAMNSRESADEDSFQNGLLDSPRYTRPRDFKNLAVPEVLISGNHRAVNKWRRKMALKATMKKRPDLLAGTRLTDEDRQMIESLKLEGG